MARAERAVIVSADTDFGTLLALRGSHRPSVIIFRGETQFVPERQLTLLRVHLPAIEKHLKNGAVVVFEEDRIRLRALPIDPH